MLVVSQRVGDKLTLGNDITVSVIEVKKGKVRLGIEAPADIEIRRSKYVGISESSSITETEEAQKVLDKRS